MPSTEPPAPAQPDEFDELFNFDEDKEDPFRPFDTTIEAPTSPKKRSGTPPIADLGIDEAIKPIKRRIPVPKLDEDRCELNCNADFRQSD